MPGFLQKYKNGPADKTVYPAEGSGFLRLVYDEEGLIYQAAFVSKENQEPSRKDLQLWFIWVNDMFTFKSESSLGGRSWNGGHPDYGTTLETEDEGRSGGEGPLVSLEDWVDRCVGEMIVAHAKK